MIEVSLEYLQDKEHGVLDKEYDSTKGLHPGTPVDKYMEINYGRMGEDSEASALREKRARKMLSQGSFPSYQP